MQFKGRRTSPQIIDLRQKTLDDPTSDQQRGPFSLFEMAAVGLGMIGRQLEVTLRNDTMEEFNARQSERTQRLSNN